MARGTLRIYLGASPGVGKTYAMLNEGWRAHERGHDVVVGIAEHYERPQTIAQFRALEVVPRKRIEYRGTEFEEMDVDAIIARRPGRVLVDELAHTNVPGSRNEKRWQDVEEIRNAGIDVISTLNIQHLESINDVVEKITGIKQQETIPDDFVRSADQVELVDQTPEALRRRMAHGNIYRAEKIDAALANYFRPGNLTALRELALLWVADSVEERLQEYMETHGIGDVWETRERILVAVKGSPQDEHLIRRGARMAARARGELLAVYVRTGEGLAGDVPEQVANDRELVSELGGTFHHATGNDVARALVEFATAEKATQVVMGESRRSRWTRLLSGSVVQRTIRMSGSVDIHVISAREESEARPIMRVPRLSPLPPRRLVAGFVLAATGTPLLTLLLANARGHVDLPAVLLAYLLLALSTAAIGGLLPGLVSALVCSLAANYYFTPPYYTFTIYQPQNVLALVVFLVTAGVVSLLVSVAARRANEAARASAEAETLARMSGSLVGHEDPLPDLMEQLRAVFGLEAVALLSRASSGWLVDAHSGTPCPTTPDQGDVSIELTDRSALVLKGRTIGAEDRRLLRAFIAQLAVALQGRRMRSEVHEAQQLKAVDELRTALLVAVSHDLRTPLASIKASVTSLLQRDVDWSDHDRDEFLRMIDSETDRLNALVGNLLDMSRLQTGRLTLTVRDIGLDEVVASVLRGNEGAGGVFVDVPDTLPHVSADPALLERAVANVVHNALEHADGSAVRIEAAEIEGRVQLRIIDRGRGIAAADRERAFTPFQRLGDSGSTGVGLGLAVARGFIEAMGGTIELEDTPGGGLTTVIGLKEAD